MDRRQLGRDGAERLGAIEGLRELSVGQRRELAALADEITAAPGETIVRQGDPGYEFMMIEQGRADVVRDGTRIDEMGPGDFFGELAVLADGASRTASVLATTDVRAIVLSGRFMRQMHDRMRAAGDRIDTVAAARLERDRTQSGS